MKIALLICGQARFFREGNETIKNIVDTYKPDIFIHTWKSKDNTFESAQRLQINISENDLAEYISLYNPKKYEIEEQLTDEFIDSRLQRLEYPRTSHPRTKYNFFSYLYSLEKSFKLVEKQEQYDLFIVLRSDAYIHAFPDLNQLDTSKIMIYDRLWHRSDVIDTIVSMIPREYISIYTEFVNHLDDYYSKGYYFNYEEMMLAHIKESDLLDRLLRLKGDQFCFGVWRSPDRIEHF